MTFKLISNSYKLGFNYRALIEPMEYSGETIITNPHTVAEITGAFLESTPTCKITNSLANIRSWFNSTNGTLVQFTIFDTAPLVAGNYRVTAVITTGGNIEIQTWQLIASVWIRQPYKINNAIPISVTGAGLSVVAGKIVGGTVGQSITCKFGFLIVPETNNFTYGRTGINELPFKCVPVGGLSYTNV